MELTDAHPIHTDLVIVHPPDLSREMYQDVLLQEGYSTAAFDDAAGARRWLASSEHVTSAVILELLPSVDDSWALIDELRTTDPAIPVIILTSVVRPDRVNRQRAEAVGVAAFVGKPCGLRQLVEVVRRVITGERGIEMTHYATR